MACATNFQKINKVARVNGIATLGTTYKTITSTSPSAIHPQVKSRRIAVLAPDKPSGVAYHSVLMANKLKADLRVVSIAPRVIGNKMNSSLEVEQDLARAIIRAHQEGFDNIS